ncbi:hypothetical protein SNOUR_35595 [Streptomyces noursei ATCC 11455]|nr:hypothetical protein SNOUR_35595 [Streptomyces noursei ATCC 11455]
MRGIAGKTGRGAAVTGPVAGFDGAADGVSRGTWGRRSACLGAAHQAGAGALRPMGLTWAYVAVRRMAP